MAGFVHCFTVPPPQDLQRELYSGKNKHTGVPWRFWGHAPSLGAPCSLGKGVPSGMRSTLYPSTWEKAYSTATQHVAALV